MEKLLVYILMGIFKYVLFKYLYWVFKKIIKIIISIDCFWVYIIGININLVRIKY